MARVALITMPQEARNMRSWRHASSTRGWTSAGRRNVADGLGPSDPGLEAGQKSSRPKKSSGLRKPIRGSALRFI